MSEPHLLSPAGFGAGAVYAGIRTRHRCDLGVLVCDKLTSAAAVFTTNRVFAAPVKVGRAHVASGHLRGVVVNSGNANACTGKQGERDALAMCQITGSHLGCPANQILPSSTGIIGRMLPMEKIEQGITAACNQVGRSAEHASQFADAILTTDTRKKTAGMRFKIGKQMVTLAGCCKGSGMIGPRMRLAGPPHATMLAYLTTDADLPVNQLRTMLEESCDESFNAVTVDDHASTNDTAVILASGLSGVKIQSSAARKAFHRALQEVCQSLAYQIAADGEGATKVVRIQVSGAKDESAARSMARAIANSPLVKCAMNGNDPNWGRIVSAAGYVGVPFNPDKSSLILQGTCVFRAGRPIRFDGAKVSKSLDCSEVRVELRCGMGRASATIWTCDLSRRYVEINADYHT